MKAVKYLMCIFSLAGCLSMNPGQGKKGQYSPKAGLQENCLQYEGEWSSNFKDMVFLSCLSRLYPIQFSEMIAKHDNSVSANMDWLNYNMEVSKVITDIAEDFIKRPEAGWNIEGVKTTMNVCLAFRRSLELDSITGVYYKKYSQK